MKMKMKIGLVWMMIRCLIIIQAWSTPLPSPWPEQFHALVVMNLSESQQLYVTDVWYDWRRGRNVNIHQKQLAEKEYSVEWNNGTSFYYSLDHNPPYCRVTHYEVGIPRPDFLQTEAEYDGTQLTGGFLCHVWKKADFIVYYEDVLTARPVRWDFTDGVIYNYVMRYEVGAVLPDSEVQAPAFCFNQDSDV
ncbi:uncharacterized protein At4g14100-like [Humulus lupulus]|uniref:uncharacterized protein At4g14100-like n=1 Tax=Humulus lupulus TaxID=3486 RepID=UPI002B408225|nr:uncharacterized protein At4g14100-like [Humulus lupulus]